MIVRNQDLAPSKVEPAGLASVNIFLCAGTSTDSWLPREQITLPALVSNESVLKAHTEVTSNGKRQSPLVQACIAKYRSMIVDKGQFYAIAEQQCKWQQDARRGKSDRFSTTATAPTEPKVAGQRYTEELAKAVHDHGTVMWVRIKSHRPWPAVLASLPQVPASQRD